jgi:hypothetical protein
MRVLFLLLVAANLAFFAWSFYIAPPDSGRDPRPLAQQVDPGKLRILKAEVIANPEAPKPAAGLPAPAAAPSACVEWGSFTAADATRAGEALVPLGLGDRMAPRKVEETAGWWVFIPPQGNRAGAQKKAVELKGFGIDDYFILQDEGPSRWALSLCVFRTEEAAKARLEALKTKGVRSAQAGPRETQVQKTWFQVRGADAALQARLRELAGGFTGSEVRVCP